MSWAGWVGVGLGCWVVVSIPAAFGVGWALRNADRRGAIRLERHLRLVGGTTPASPTAGAVGEEPSRRGSLPVHLSPRPLRALRRTRPVRQLTDRAFAIGCCAFVAADLRLLDLVHQIAPISTGLLP